MLSCLRKSENTANGAICDRAGAILALQPEPCMHRIAQINRAEIKDSIVDAVINANSSSYTVLLQRISWIAVTLIKAPLRDPRIARIRL